MPIRHEPLAGVKPVATGVAGLRRVNNLLGGQGLPGVFITCSCSTGNEEQLDHYPDHPEALAQVKANRLAEIERRLADLLALRPEDRPDFRCVGGSGTLVFQAPDSFRRQVLPAVKRASEVARPDR